MFSAQDSGSKIQDPQLLLHDGDDFIGKSFALIHHWIINKMVNWHLPSFRSNIISSLLKVFFFFRYSMWYEIDCIRIRVLALRTISNFRISFLDLYFSVSISCSSEWEIEKRHFVLPFLIIFGIRFIPSSALCNFVLPFSIGEYSWRSDGLNTKYTPEWKHFGIGERVMTVYIECKREPAPNGWKRRRKMESQRLEQI